MKAKPSRQLTPEVDERHLKPTAEPVVEGLLQDYLDDLLAAATKQHVAPLAATQVAEPHIATQVIEPEIATQIVEPEVQVTFDQPLYIVDGEIQGWGEIEPPSVEPSGIDSQAIIDTTPELATQTDIQAPSRLVSEPENTYPAEVNCMIFSVAGVKLAIPMAMLGGIHRLEKRVKRIVGQADWCMGIWANEQKKLHLIDSLLYIMPERVKGKKQTDYQFLLQLDSSSWALACDEVYDTRQISDSDIRRHPQPATPKWKAGTIISEVCTLIDVPGLLSLLKDADSPAEPSTCEL